MSSSPNTQAAPINYVESVDGDIPQNLNPLMTFTLDAGLNTVSGAIAFEYRPPTFPSDNDSFAFVVPPEMELRGINVQLAEEIGTFRHVTWWLLSGAAGYGLGALTSVGEFSVDPPSRDLLDAPLPPNAYIWYQITYTISDVQPINVLHYTITFDVHTIPEPASLVLFALAPLLVSRRRR